ncbi:unnamed protein product [Phyllotreta striolata]|uniref:Medium-chain acyl-CoA ligase ACSF2, mitochondrial n=1 Tax=Phyllotreta striolata TaxID=444603 RepID=A0A9N9TX93_PHYSR|nr:unnamed protein product [Phyllotreta striolata]
MEEGLSYIKGSTDEPLASFTIGQYIEKFSENFRDEVIVISREQKKKLTVNQLLEESDKFASGLYSLGLKRGDYVGIIVKNSVEALIVNFACIRGGFVTVNLHPALQPREIEGYLNTLEVRCIVCVDKYKGFSIIDSLKKVVPEIGCSPSVTIESKSVPSLKRLVVISDKQYEGTIQYEALMSYSGESASKETLENNKKLIDPHDIFAIIFTSGSTGNSKIVGLTHHQLTNCMYFLRKRFPAIKRGDKLCFHLPLFHIFGLGFSCIGIANGITIVLPSLYYDPRMNLEAISEENCALLIGTPTMFSDLIAIQKELNLPISPKIAMPGGAGAPASLYTDVLKILHVKQVQIGYGLSEAAAATWPDASILNDFTTTGRLMDHLEAKIVDESGNLVPIGTPGELLLRGYSVIKKYLHYQAETLEDDGWFRTGDMVSVDGDGKFHVTGRFKDIINRGGEKISPGEVEMILESHPSIQEVYVVGTKHDRLGEEVCACCKLKPDSTLTLEEIKEYCKGKLSYYKIPSRIEIMDAFPKTLIGKIQKNKLAQSLSETA